MSRPTCSSCFHYEEPAAAASPEQPGLCRLNPPRTTAYPMPVQDALGRQRLQPIYLTAWAAVQPNDFCGQHRPEIHLAS